MRAARSTKRRKPVEKSAQLDFRHLALGGVAALLAATPLIPSESVAEIGAGLFLNLFWLLLLLAWAGSGVVAGRWSVRLDAATGAAIVFAGLIALSGLMMAGSGNPRATINSVWQWVALIVAFFLLRQWIAAGVEQRALCAVMIGLAVAVAVLGLYQYFVSNPAMQKEFWLNPENAYREVLGDHPTPQMKKLLWDRVLSVEPIATFALTNSLAGFLVPWLVLASGVALSLWQGGARQWKISLAGLLLALVLLCGCLFLTKSRTAWLAAACGLGLVVLSNWRAGRQISGWLLAAGAAGAMLVFLGAVMTGGVDVEVFSEAPKSLLYRMEYWQATAALIRDYPWWGVGPGNFQNYYPAYKLPQASETIADPHNFILEIAATAGVIAALAFAAFLAAAAFQLRRSSEDEEETASGSAGGKSPEATTIYGVYIGALVGVLLAFPIALVAGFRVDQHLLWVGVPAGAICVALLHPWTRRGDLPANLPIIAAAVMLLNLLAAGGIGFASVATSFWLLAATALASSRRGSVVVVFGRTYAIGAALAAAAIGIAFYFTAYRPTLTARAAMNRAEEATARGAFAAAEEQFAAAAAADPRSPLPWQQLASLYAQDWISTGSANSLAAFERSWPEAAARNQRSYGLWQQIGDYYFQGYWRHAKPEFLQASLNAQRKAAVLYPAKAPLRAELAWRLHLAGDDSAAAAEAESALNLDRQNPHLEQKLAEFPAPEGAEVDNLEHLAENLRKLE